MDAVLPMAMSLDYMGQHKTNTNLIICIGNGNEKAAEMTKSIGDSSGRQFRGFLNKQTELLDGIYHTSIYDINIADLALKLENNNVEIVMLDQDASAYPNFYDFESTLKLGDHFKDIYPLRYQNHKIVPWILKILKSNKSFCVMPFIGSNQNTVKVLSSCCYMDSRASPVKKSKEEIQNKMFDGAMIEECHYCYDMEQRGSLSPRNKWNQEYVSLLDIKTKEDLLRIDSAQVYHIAVDNQCNLLCRMCSPEFSHLIEKEYHKIGLIPQIKSVIRPSNIFEQVDLKAAKRILIVGGEPTINEQFIQSLEKLATTKYNDIEIVISTNAVVLPARLKTLCKTFAKLKFSVSIDGFDRINHYIRWPADWEKIKQNIRYFHDTGRLFNFNTTVSIYNVAHLYELYQYIDQNFSETDCSMNFVSDPDHQSPWNHPDKDKVLADLEKIKKLSLYHNKISFQSLVDGIELKMQNQSNVDVTLLKRFFHFNDMLDVSRNVQLKDYIVELEDYRI
jgi:sulfatase maturation enzyme AslB (radical SAM superfamily)